MDRARTPDSARARLGSLPAPALPLSTTTATDTAAAAATATTSKAGRGRTRHPGSFDDPGLNTMAHVPSAVLVYPHDARAEPPILPSGTPTFSLNPHQMNWPHDQEPSSSSSSSGSHPSPSYPLMPGHHPAPLFQSAPSLSTRYSRGTDHWRDGEESDPETGYVRLQTAGQAGTRRDARQYPDAFSQSSRDHSPVSMNSAPFLAEAEPRHRNSHGYSRFAPYHVPTHSRGESSSTGSSDNRAPSPALSVASIQTSNSSYGPPSQLPVHPLLDVQPVQSYTRAKYTKQRLYNIDRKKICVYADENPNLRQEDIARKFNIERSTVSKILKNKHRWLSIDDEPPLLIAKQRQAKFPGIEMRMEEWVRNAARKNVILTDAMLRKQALEFSAELGYPPANFKASPGWVENFKARVGIKQGIYHGNGKRAMIPKAMGAFALPPGWELPNLHNTSAWAPGADMSIGPVERVAAQERAAWAAAEASNAAEPPRQDDDRSRDAAYASDSQQPPSVPLPTAAPDVQPHWDSPTGAHEQPEQQDERIMEQDLGTQRDSPSRHPQQQSFADAGWYADAAPAVSTREEPSAVTFLPSSSGVHVSDMVADEEAGVSRVEQHLLHVINWMEDQRAQSNDFDDEYDYLLKVQQKIMLHHRSSS